MPAWVNVVIAAGGAFGTFITAVATIFLWKVTKLLAIETKRMGEIASQPHVVATIEPNRWAMNHVDIHVSNTGNATAYNIDVIFTPPLTNGLVRANKDVPLQNISVLKPGQTLSSYLSEFTNVKDINFEVKISWQNNTNVESRETNIYLINMAEQNGVSRLGEDPIIQMASSIKKIDESLKSISGTSKRIEAAVKK